MILPGNNPVELTITALTGIPEVEPGDDLAAILLGALAENGVSLQQGDVLVVAQKIISKSENRYRDLDEITPSLQALELAKVTEKDPRLVELILSESAGVVRATPGVLIVRHRNGFVMANAGIDASNLPGMQEGRIMLLLPEDADKSAKNLQMSLSNASGVPVGVVISDSFGRPWRNGVTNVAIGSAGIPSIVDKRDFADLAGRKMQVTQVAVGDLVASAAGLLMGETDEAIPAALLRGLPEQYRVVTDTDGGSQALVRPLEQDLFQ